MAKNKAALYLRVSTVYQVDKDSLPLQRKDLIAYSEMVLGIDDYEVFEDAGFSGKNTARPAYQEMMNRTRKGEFSHILVWKIDRISRNLLDFAEMYTELKRLRVAFVSKNERFDTSTPMGEAMLKIILVFAELERNMTSMRVSAVMKDRAKQGEWNGANIPYGYDWDAEKKYPVPNPVEAPIIRKMFEIYVQEKSIRRVTRLLISLGAKTKRGGKWNYATVLQMLKNPFYKGTLRYNYKEAARGKVKPESEWILKENNHEAMVSPELWQRCNDILTSNRNFKGDTGKRNISQEEHIFSGLLKCSLCGYPLRSHIMLRKNGHNPSYYECYRKYQYVDPCTAKGNIKDELLLPALLTYITRIMEARKHPAQFTDTKQLQSFLLDSSLLGAKGIEEIGDLYRGLSQSYYAKQLSLGEPAQENEIDLSDLIAQKAQKERALKRLTDIYLYSDESMSVEEYMASKRKLKAELEAIEKDIEEAATSKQGSSEQDFLALAKQFILLKKISSCTADFSFKSLYTTIGRSTLKQFFNEILTSVDVENDKIKSITFKNGVTHTFVY